MYMCTYIQTTKETESHLTRGTQQQQQSVCMRCGDKINKNEVEEKNGKKPVTASHKKKKLWKGVKRKPKASKSNNKKKREQQSDKGKAQKTSSK